MITKLKNKFKIKRDKSGNKQIIHITYVFSGLFLALIIYLILFVCIDSGDFINNPYNSREEIFEETIIRGNIYSRDGKILAYTDTSTGKDVRIYPYSNAFAHVVGYASNGKMGIESAYNYSLLDSNILVTERIENDLEGIQNPGDSVISTLDVDMQMAAYTALEGNKGAVIAMNCTTGDILAMVSAPNFNPNTIANDWEYINSMKDNSVLLNRAIQGVYPPGSTFKIVTALEYIIENGSNPEYLFDCKGNFSYDGTTINCYHGQSHGVVDFKKSFAKSCNSSFANITTELDKASFEQTCNNLLFNEKLPCPFNNVKESYVPINLKSSTDELMQTGIGQGLTSVTPYHICLITSAIANEGILVEPRLVSSIVTANGDSVKTYKNKEYKRLMSKEDADYLSELMREVVLSGTASKVKDTNGYEAYGKTGSAEYNSDKSASHAWFTGFAKSGDEKISVTVIIEGGGSGGERAVPIAKKVFDGYFK